MKRRARSDIIDTGPKRSSRQDPVSCESCRRKKLKCNRQQPCSSCVTRRLTCAYGPGSIMIDTDKAEAQSGNKNDTSASGEKMGIQSQGMHSVLRAPPVADPPPSQTTKESLNTVDWLEKIVMGDRVPTAIPRQLRNGMDESIDEGNLVKPSHSRSLPGTLLSMSFGNWTASSEDPARVNLISFLPKKHETMAIFQYYSNYIDYLYHVIIPRRVESQINGIYQSVENGQPPNLNHLALLFSIAASSLYLQLSIESTAYAEVCSREFAFLTGAALIQNNYAAYPTIEGLQATIIVMHNLSNMHSHPSINSLFVHGAIVSQAKNLMLHCIDSPRYREERETSGFEAVELETKRRLWWDIASYDWLLGFLSGPQEWTYLINPDFMNVQLPSNIDDDVIPAHGNIPSLPASTPTDMSYALQRLNLAIACREIVNEMTHEQLHGINVAYDKILKLDSKLHDLCDKIPEFFRLDPISRRRFAPLYHSRPQIAWQRCLVQQGYYSRFCRLHREYFIRGAREPAYSYSHVICLQSARKVLEIKRIMDEDEPAFMPPSSIVWSVMHHVFMAAVVLLMDVCFNWDDILANKRKEEVLDACRMLSKAQQSSSLVKEGINAMMGVLQKYWKSGKQSFTANQQMNPPSSPVLSGVNVAEPAQPIPATSASYCDPTSIFSINDSDGPPLNDMNLDNHEKHLEDIWTEMLDCGGDLALDTPEWTGLLTELTNATLPCS